MGIGAKEVGRSVFFEVLAIRSFRRLWFGQIASQLAVSTMLFVLALRVYETTGSNAAVSGLFLSYGIPALLFGMAAGSVVDHLDKRTVLMICDLSRAILALGLIFLSHNIAAVYMFTFVHAMITQFYVPAEASMIPVIVPGKRLVTANSLFSFTYYSSLALGSVLSGPFLRFFTVHGVFVVIALLFTGAALCVTALPKTARFAHELSRIIRLPFVEFFIRMVMSVGAGIRYVKRSPVLSDALLLLTGTQILLTLLGTLGPGFADDVLHIDIRDASLVLVGPTIAGIILGALWVGQVGVRIPQARLTKWGIIGSGIILLSISLVVAIGNIAPTGAILPKQTIIPLSLLLFFLLGVANSMLDVPANSMLQKESEGMLRGRVYGMLTSAVGGIGILPVLIGGILADVLGVGTVVFLIGIAVLAYGTWRVRYNTG